MKQNKKIYQDAEIEVIYFGDMGIITTSGGLDEDEVPPLIIS